MAKTAKRALLISAGTRFAEALAQDGYEVRPTTVDAVADRAAEMKPTVIVVGAEVEHDVARAIVADLVSEYDCTSFIVADAYSPDALASVLDVGVDGFVQSAVSDTEFLRVVNTELEARARRTTNETEPGVDVPEMVGSSEPMKDLCRLLAKTAPSSLPVLVTGESGTGKELVARSIHRLSPRRGGPFIAVNCGAIPETLIESELFGHEKGAFTGATDRKMGKFEAAHHGTLFLDEIGELPIGMQVKLLRVLENQQFQRVGGTESISVDVRVVCATNRDLATAVEEGDFRADLLYRIDVLRIESPPLRRRKSDIQLLWEHFVRQTARQEGREALETRPDVVRMLMQYDWPGNVRELENVARQAVIRRSTGKITPRIVRDRLRGGGAGAASDETEELASTALRSLEEIERDAIIRTYHSVDSVKEAAEILGISERKMYYRLKQYRQKGFLESDDEPGKQPRLVFAHAERDAFERAQPTLSDSYQTVWVEDGMGLLNEVYESNPAALVVQAKLPVLDGINILELGYEHGWELPIVLIGDPEDETTREYAEALGAAAFLDDALDGSELAWVLDTALNVTTA